MALEIVVVCDKCKTELCTEAFGIRHAEEIAQRNGWASGPGIVGDFCPKCKLQREVTVLPVEG